MPLRLLFLLLFPLVFSTAPAATFQLEHLAYSVDTRPLTNLGSPNPTYRHLVIRDHHEDHYHDYSGTEGNDARNAHVADPFKLAPDQSSAAVHLGAWNFSPDAPNNYWTIPVGLGAPDPHQFQLTLSAITTPIGGESALTLFLNEAPLTLSIGSTLAFGSTFDALHATLASDAPLGLYTASFIVSHPEGTYISSAPFKLHFQAVPEPSMLAWIGLFALGAMSRRFIKRNLNA